jgi:polyhydroxybutyrate depolymerase
MKKTLYILFLFVCFKGIAQTTTTKTINVNGTNRQYKIYIPAIYNSNTAVPVIFNFHGYTSNMTAQENYGDFRSIADTANFILVHPQGLDIGGGAGWNNFAAYSASNYDYNFFNQMLDSMLSQYSINDKRVYSTGMSNGGFMSYDLGCFFSTRVTAIASVTGSVISSHLNACNPTRKVPVMQIHGTSDPTVSYSGTGGGLTSTGIEALVNFWVTKNNANPTAIVSQVPNINSFDNTTATHYKYEVLNGDVEFYKITGGGHTWPGTIFSISGQNTCQDFNASMEIWRFFSKYSIQNALNVNELSQEVSLDIFPNPASNSFSIKVSNFESENLIISNASGQILEKVLLVKGQINTISLDKYENGLYFIKVGGKVESLLIQK